jgi:hypothetical protein
MSPAVARRALLSGGLARAGHEVAVPGGTGVMYLIRRGPVTVTVAADRSGQAPSLLSGKTTGGWPTSVADERTEQWVQ